MSSFSNDSDFFTYNPEFSQEAEYIFESDYASSQCLSINDVNNWFHDLHNKNNNCQVNILDSIANNTLDGVSFYWDNSKKRSHGDDNDKTSIDERPTKRIIRENKPQVTNHFCGKNQNANLFGNSTENTFDSSIGSLSSVNRSTMDAINLDNYRNNPSSMSSKNLLSKLDIYVKTIANDKYDLEKIEEPTMKIYESPLDEVNIGNKSTPIVNLNDSFNGFQNLFPDNLYNSSPNKISPENNENYIILNKEQKYFDFNEWSQPIIMESNCQPSNNIKKFDIDMLKKAATIHLPNNKHCATINLHKKKFNNTIFEENEKNFRAKIFGIQDIIENELESYIMRTSKFDNNYEKIYGVDTKNKFSTKGSIDEENSIMIGDCSVIKNDEQNRKNEEKSKNYSKNIKKVSKNKKSQESKKKENKVYYNINEFLNSLEINSKCSISKMRTAKVRLPSEYHKTFSSDDYKSFSKNEKEALIKYINDSIVNPIYEITGFRFVSAASTVTDKRYNKRFVCSQDVCSQRRGKSKDKKSLSNRCQKLNQCNSSLSVSYYIKEKYFSISFRHLTHEPYMEKRVSAEIKQYIISRIDVSPVLIYKELNSSLVSASLNSQVSNLTQDQIRWWWSRLRVSK